MKTAIPVLLLMFAAACESPSPSVSGTPRYTHAKQDEKELEAVSIARRLSGGRHRPSYSGKPQGGWIRKEWKWVWP